MVAVIESRETHKGVRPIHSGDRDGDLAVVFSGRAFLENIDYLTELNVAFTVRNLGWSEEVARPFVTRELNVDSLTGGRTLTPELVDMVMQDSRKAVQVPSTVLLRKELARPGEYFGLSSGRMFFIQTREGEKPVFFHILRAIENRYRGRHRGRSLVELELLAHSQSEAYIHRSDNAMALYTNTKLASLVLKGNHPITAPFIEGSTEYSIAQQVLDLTTVGHHALGLDGVVRGLYREPNLSYVPDPKYSAYKFYERMIAPAGEGGFGMDLPGGDAMMSYYPVR